MSRKDAHAFASTACVDPSPPRSGSQSSSSRQGMEPMAPSPPMKSTVTRFRWFRNSTRGPKPKVLEKARAWRDSAVLGLFACQPSRPPGTTRRQYVGTPNEKQERS